MCSDDDNDNCLQARKKNLQDDGIVWKKPGEEEQNKNDKLLNMNVTNDGNGDGDNDDDDHHHRNKIESSCLSIYFGCIFFLLLRFF